MKKSIIITMLKRALFTGMFLLGLLSVKAQIPGIYHLDSMDYCTNVNSSSMVAWVGTAGPITTNDIMDFHVIWGDASYSSYPGHTIYAYPNQSLYVSSFYINHTYSTPGTYPIKIIAEVTGVWSDTLFDTILVTNTCGSFSGQVAIDNGDAVMDWNDLYPAGTPLILTTPTLTYGTVTGMYGSYNIQNVDHNLASYSLTVDPVWMGTNSLSYIAPASGIYNINPSQVMNWSGNFLLTCNGIYNDLSTNGYGFGFRAGMSTGYVLIDVNSFSCDGSPANTNVSVTFDPLLTVYQTSFPSHIVTGNTIHSNIGSLNGNAQYIVFFTVPGLTPASTPLLFDVNVQTSSYTETYTANNHFSIQSEVRNSWDPNDKSTNVGPFIDANVTDEIYYNVRFQNMGNDDAYNIYIVDTIDAQLDLSTFRLVAQSHPGSYSIDPATRIVKFTFPNINLVPQSVSDPLSQGYVRYKIKENAGLPMGSVIENTAYIYFDENAPVITNTTQNTNAILGTEDMLDEKSVTIYPQPASSVFTIEGIDAASVTGLTLVDMNGKVKMQLKNVSSLTGINIQDLPNGMYLVNINTNENTISKKLIINH